MSTQNTWSDNIYNQGSVIPGLDTEANQTGRTAQASAMQAPIPTAPSHFAEHTSTVPASADMSYYSQKPAFQVQLPPSQTQQSQDRPPYGSGDSDDGYTLEFASLDEFQAWRAKEEDENMVEFIKGDSHGSKAIPPRFKDHTKLVCARHCRSGRKKYIKKYPERNRKVPSRKIEGEGCPASISYKTYHESSIVRAMYISQHSHSTGLANLPFTKRGRKLAEEERKSQQQSGYSRANPVLNGTADITRRVPPVAPPYTPLPSRPGPSQEREAGTSVSLPFTGNLGPSSLTRGSVAIENETRRTGMIQRSSAEPFTDTTSYRLTQNPTEPFTNLSDSAPLHQRRGNRNYHQMDELRPQPQPILPHSPSTVSSLSSVSTPHMPNTYASPTRGSLHNTPSPVHRHHRHSLSQLHSFPGPVTPEACQPQNLDTSSLAGALNQWPGSPPLSSPNSHAYIQPLIEQHPYNTQQSIFQDQIIQLRNEQSTSQIPHALASLMPNTSHPASYLNIEAPQPPIQIPTPVFDNERWSRLAVLFNSVHKRAYEVTYPPEAVNALEAALLQLFKESVPPSLSESRTNSINGSGENFHGVNPNIAHTAYSSQASSPTEFSRFRMHPTYVPTTFVETSTNSPDIQLGFPQSRDIYTLQNAGPSPS